jgi:Acyltransferase family
MRGFSLLIVIAWHWCFTIILWKSDGPHATNPIGFTDGMWTITWLLQVMPLFFYVGGFSNLVAWRKKESTGGALSTFVWGRVKQLAIPSIALAQCELGCKRRHFGHQPTVVHRGIHANYCPLSYLSLVA